MKTFYLVRGATAAKIIVPVDQRFENSFTMLPRDSYAQADFVFYVQEDGTVEFLKNRANREKYSFTLERALKTIDHHYRGYNIEMLYFNLYDFTKTTDYVSYSELGDKLTKNLREGFK